MPNEFKVKNGLIVDQGGLNVTGSTAISGSVTVTGSVTATNFTGSLFGTASWANNVVSASYADNGGVTQIVAGTNVTISPTSGTGSVTINAAAGAAFPFTGSALVTGSLTVTGSTISTLGFTGSLLGTASYALYALTASSAQNASDILIYVKNTSGAQINKGRVVRITGAVGDNPLIGTASYFNDNESANTLGITYENIANDSFGYIITEGTLLGINTDAFTASQLIYLGDTGSIIGTAPVAPLHAVRLGQVLRSQLNNGSIYVRIDNGFELGELHDVRDTTTTGSYGDLLVKSGSIWINSKQLTGSYGLTGSLTATTINTTYLTASGNNYPTNSGTSSFFLQTDGAGTLSWNYVRSVLESVKNVGATTLVKGTPVYVTSSVGNTAEVVKADAASASLMPATYILNETLTAGQQGLGIVLGFINNIDTSTFAESDEIYVAAGGGYTNIQPTGSVLIQPLGTVVRVDNTNGSIMISNSGLTNSLPNINPGHTWIGNNDWLPVAVPTSSFKPYIDNIVTVGLSGSATGYNVIKTAVDSITDASENNTYTVRVYPGVYIEDTMTIPSYVTVKGDSSTSTIVSASNPSASIFVMSDQTMVIDMQIQGSTGPGASAIYYSSPTTPQRNAIAYAENIRFGTNYTNATCEGSGSGNCILQCSNVKYGGYTDAVSQKSFDIGFRVTGSGGSIGRMQLRNVTSTNGGVAGTDNNQIFALADAPGCTFIVNGCLLTRATGTARGTGFKVYNGGSLRLTGVNFQRWINGIWAPQTGSAPSIDAVALNFENCTYDVLIEHTGSTGKVQGTDTFLKTVIPYEAPLYEVNTDQRKILVNKKGGDFTSISASVAYITDSSANNRYTIEVGPGQFTEKQIDLRNKPYVSIVGSTIQTTQILASGSGNYDQILLGPTNEISFLSINGVNAAGYAAIKVDGTGDNFAQAHKISIYDFDYGIKVFSSVSSSTFYGEYIDINGAFSYGTYVSSSNTLSSNASMENYYLFPSGGVSIGNYAIGSGAELDLYTCLFVGDNVSGSTAVYLADSAVAEVAGFDAQNWEYGVRVPNIGSAPTFRMVGAMIHNSITSDFFIEKVGTIGRFQGISDHNKINNVSEEFYWNFLDDTDGENDVTRKLSVTFADGTHTDATTLIFKGSPMGVMQGGEITISGSLTITTAAGFGYLQDAVTTDVYKRIDWINTNLTLTANSNNYIYLDDAGVLSAASSAPSSITNIILGRVVTNDTGIEFIDQSPYDGEHMSNKLSKFNREALGPVFAEGSIVTEDVTPFKLDVTQGSYYFSENNFLPSGTSSINLNRYYISGSGWNRSTSSIVPNNVYASGSALVAMSASYYTKHTVYLVGDGVDEEYFLVINGNQYASLVQAEGANLPTIPTYFSDGVVPLAAVYVQSGSANITQIEDIRPVIGFRAAGVNASAVHGNLLGLTADDHLQYLLVDGTRQMSGDLGLGGNDLYNFNLISGSAITASVATITSITGSLFGNASSATTASYVLNAVSSSFAATASRVTSASFASTASIATSASFAATASFAPLYVLTSQTSSFVQNSQTSSFVLNSQTSSMSVASASQAATASSADNFTVRGTLTAQTIIVQTITSSTDFVTGSTRFGSLLANTHQFTGSVSITGSLSVNNNSVVTSNQTSSFVLNSQTSSFVTNAQTSSFVRNSQTSSFVTNSQTSSFVLNSQTSSMSVLSASYASGSTSASFASTAALAPLYVLTSATSSMLSPYVLNSQTSSFVTNAQTSSFVLNSQTASMTVATASFATSSLSASYAANGGVTQITAGTNVTISPTSGLGNVTINATAGAAFPYTGSALITGSLVITGSTTSTLGFTGSLQGTASWATNAISSSYPFAVSGTNLYSVYPFSNIPNDSTSSIYIGENAGTESGFGIRNAVIIGNNAGGIQSSLDGVYIGTNAGYNAFYGNQSVFIGKNSGKNSGNGRNSVFIGNDAGKDNLDGDRAVNIGLEAGVSSSAFDTVFIGYGAGGYSYSNHGIYLGYFAGDSTTGDYNIAMGRFAGLNAFNSSNVIFIGQSAGSEAADASNSVFMGLSAGYSASNASNSIFIGDSAGVYAISASYSTIIGTNAGYRATNNLIGRNNIIIGTKVTLENGRQDSINIGGIIFGTGSYYSVAAGNAFSGSANGRIGINVVNPQYTLDVSGSGNFTNGVTASLFGTASWANNSLTASIATSASFAATASFAPLYVLNSQTSSMTVATASFATSSLSASFAATASSADNFTVRGTLTAQTIIAQTITSSTDFVTGSTRFGSIITNTHQFTGSVSISGSLTINGNGVVTNNLTSSFVQNSQTSSFVTNAQTSSFVLNSQTSSMTVATASIATSASYAATASFAPLYVLTSATSSMLSPYVLNSQTSSFVQNSQTSSFVTNSQTSSFVLNSQTSSFVRNSQTASMTVATASFATSSLSSSFATSASFATTASFAVSASWAPGGGSSAITIADEGTTQGTATYLNFIGTGVTATVSANTGSITISGGGGLSTKSNAVASGSFTGNPKKATVTFGTAFANTNYSITVTGEDARSWTIESKATGSFIINANSNTNLAGTTYWQAIVYGES